MTINIMNSKINSVNRKCFKLPVAGAESEVEAVSEFAVELGFREVLEVSVFRLFLLFYFERSLSFLSCEKIMN